MKPIYFPSTWISEPIQSVLYACFDQVVLYSPHSELVPETHRDLAARERLEIRLLKEESGDNLPMLLESYHTWVQLHEGERPDFHKFSALYSAAPRDPSSREIRSQILNEGRGQEPRKNHAADPLERARLFLAITQQYDQQQASLAKDLHKISDMQQDLLRQLAPEREETASVKPGTHPLESLEIFYPMATERLAAWRLLYRHHRRQTEGDGPPPPSCPPLLVTADPDVFEHLKDSGVAAEAVCMISNIPFPGEETAAAGREEINEALCSAAEGRPLPNTLNISLSENREHSKNTAALTIYRMKGDIAAARFPGRGDSTVPHETGCGNGEIPNTFIGCITGKLGA